MWGLATRATERRELANSELGLGRHILHGATCEPAAQLRDARDPPGDQRFGGRRAGDRETRTYQHGWARLTRGAARGRASPGLALDVAFAG